MDKQLYWILYGVLIALGVQIIYDEIDLFTDQLVVKVGIRIIMFVIFAVVLISRKNRK